MYSDELVHAVIFPISKQHFDRIMDDGKTVFAKFTSYKNKDLSKPLRVGKGTKLIFYETRANKEIIGEATVSRSELVPSKDVFSRFSENLFLTKSELDEYIHMRPMRTEKHMLVLQLESPRRYKRPLKCPVAVTMTGIYISPEQYENMFK